MNFSSISATANDTFMGKALAMVPACLIIICCMAFFSTYLLAPFETENPSHYSDTLCQAILPRQEQGEGCPDYQALLYYEELPLHWLWFQSNNLEKMSLFNYQLFETQIYFN